MYEYGSRECQVFPALAVTGGLSQGNPLAHKNINYIITPAESYQPVPRFLKRLTNASGYATALPDSSKSYDRSRTPSLEAHLWAELEGYSPIIKSRGAMNIETQARPGKSQRVSTALCILAWPAR